MVPEDQKTQARGRTFRGSVDPTDQYDTQASLGGRRSAASRAAAGRESIDREEGRWGR